MTATDELRAMLDERGVEWMPVAWNHKRETFYHTSNGVGFCADEYADGVKIYTDATITPEQAIEATLGRGECHVIATKKLGELFGYRLSCGHSMVNLFDDRPDYCPWCGAEVVK